MPSELTNQTKVQHRELLHCPSCKNDRRFEAVIAFAVNLVTADGTVVRETCSEVSHYRCADCGEDVSTPEGWVTTGDLIE